MPGPIAVRNVTIGKLTSTVWSETRASAIALAWLDADAAQIGARLAAPGPHGPVTAEVTREAFKTWP